MRIGDREIGPHVAPFVVAEMSGNHNQSLDRALQIVDAAAEAGVDAIKLQTYTADTMTLDIREREFVINNPQSLWCGQSMYDLYAKAYTPWEWHRPIFERCRKHGLIAFSTAFDVSAIEFLEEIGVPVHKIASPENIDLPLIRKAASTGKPLIISAGMATEEELAEAAETARSAGCSELMLLKCTTDYPSIAQESNLRTLPDMRTRFQVEVGLSDHTLGIDVAVASVAFGAALIEKHLTLSRKDGGVDAAFSLEPNEMKNLVAATRNAWESLGEVHYGPTTRERANVGSRRSLYVAKDIQKGEVLTQQNIRSIRPGKGLPPKYMEIVLGKRAKRLLRKGVPLEWEMVEGGMPSE